ncbi:hypothetical protein [Ornithinimicrobium murale]|uniref:hypothetical protein n=1 Tax=Ornithinimicrobium murale TaxID=1050153 RepID=UPI000E0D73D1|nr:hypothetical protein [Ornithinimicrobium murale]
MSEHKLDYSDVHSPPIDQRGHRHTNGFDTTFHVTWLNGEFLSAMPLHGVFRCATCDAYPEFSQGTDRKTLVAKTSCALPDGIESVVHLDVPSGRIIINDSLWPVYDVGLPFAPSYNAAAGQVLHNEAMAKIGCAFGQVGNSSPSLVRIAPGRYVIASFDPDAGPGEEGHLGGDVEVLATVCTDLWAYSVADYADYLAKAAGHSPAELERQSGATVVDVEPGTYRFRNHAGRADFDLHGGDWPLVFAHIERVGPTKGEN